MPDRETNSKTRLEGLQQFKERLSQEWQLLELFNLIQASTGTSKDVCLACRESGPGLTVKQMYALTSWYFSNQLSSLSLFLL